MNQPTSTAFAKLTAEPATVGTVSTPAAATQASASRAAGGAGIKNVCNSISASFNAINVEAGTFLLNLRDGATGAGTIIWSKRVGPFPVNTQIQIDLKGLNISGTANTPMTLEFGAAPAAGNFQSCSLSTYNAT